MKPRLVVPLALGLLLLAAAAPAGAAPPERVVRDAQGLDVTLSFDAPRLETAGDHVVPRIEGLPLHADRPGAPALPLRLVHVLLPPGQEVAGVRVLGQPTALPGRHEVAWGQPPVPIGQTPAAPVPRDPAVYESEEPYPPTPARLVRSGTFRGYTVAALALRPVQFLPARGELRAWSTLRLRLELEAREGKAGALGPRGRQEDRRALRNLVLNPEHADAYGSSRSSDAVDADEPWLVICPEALRIPFERLLDHRAATGTPGRLMTVEEIESEYDGVDTPEKMRAAIRDAYQSRGTRFVLLGGDDVGDGGETLVPYRGCLLDAGGYRYEDAPSDFYFGALDGSWNADGDGVWCEPEEIDYYSEVHVGRATVDTVEEAQGFVDKVIEYEQGLAEERRTDLVWIGESLDSSTWGGDSKDVTAGLIPEEEYAIDRLYEREGTFSRQAVIDALNRGPHLTNHLGHANSGYVMGIYRSDVDGLTNETPFFSYSQGCDAGAFDESFSGSSEAISERFLTADNAAFGVVMNVRYGWYSSGSTNGPSQYFDHEFYDALFSEDLRTLGEANDDSRHDNAPASQSDPYLRWCFLETNLHGDPATPVHVGRRFGVAAKRVIDEDPEHGNANGEADPGETVRLAITLENLRSEDAHDVEAVLLSAMEGVVVRDSWARFGDIPGNAQVENAAPHYSVTLDVPCGRFAAMTLDVRWGDGERESLALSVLVGERTPRTLFADTFEEDEGWSASGTCADGQWERGVPAGTFNGDRAANPGEDAPSDEGGRAYVTGNEGVGPDDDDVDAGTAILTSPALDSDGYLDLDVSYSRWFYISPFTTPPTSTMRVEASGDGGASWVELERLTKSATPWTRTSFDLGSVIPLGGSVALRVVAEEMPGGTRDVIIEAGLDHVVFDGTWTQCDAYDDSCSAPPPPVGPTLEVSQVSEHARLVWQAPEGGGEHGPATFYRVERSPLDGGSWENLGDAVETRWTDCGACADGASYRYLVTAWNEAGDETP